MGKTNIHLPIRLLTCIFFLLSTPLYAQIYINELMQSNINTIMDDLNDYPDSWVELYNAGDKAVNLENYGLGTKAKYSSAYKLPYVSLPAKSYLIIYCDKAEKGLHTDFRLESGSKGNIYLFDASGTEIDGVTNMASMPAPDIAYGRSTDGGNEWNYFVAATPGTSNNSAIASKELLPAPLFSVTGGIFSSDVELSLSKPEGAPSNAVVRYTTNGSEPTRSSAILNDGQIITIRKTAVIRAKLFADDALSPMSTSHSYIFHSRKVTLPIISIITDNKNFYDNKIGIYVTGTYPPGTDNFWYSWRRPINFEYIHPEEGAVLNQLGETRLSGNASKEAPMKSLAVYGHKRFGQKHYDYQLFPDKPNIPIKSFLMRNSGNDFMWSHFRDAAIQLTCHRGGMDLDWQGYQPAIWYLNGVYMGIINLRERSNEDHTYSNYNKLEDIDMFENWKELKAGSWDNLNAFQEFYTQHGNSYEDWEKWMDVSEFMNMLILNTYHVNLDFPGNNIVMWRPTAEEGRWRWIIKDTDFGLGLYSREYQYNYLNFILRTGEYEENWANGWDETRLFRRLMDNAQFKDKFIDRFAVALGDFLSNEFQSEIIDSLKNNITFEYQYHQKRYPSYNNWLNWNDEVSNMKNWTANRTNYMYRHLREYFGLGAVTNVKINSTNSDAAYLEVTVNENRLSRGRFNGKFFIGRELRLSATSLDDSKEVTSWKLTKTINGATTTDIVEGNEVKYTLPQNCSSLSLEAVTSPATGLSSDAQLESKWQVASNRNKIIVTVPAIGTELSVFTPTGELLYRGTIEDKETTIEVSQMGIYLVTVASSKKIESKKVMVAD